MIHSIKKICDAGCDFDGQEFPLSSAHRYTGRPIVFHTIVSTPNGDGGYEYQGQDIGVDAGMLCIAECAEGWNEKFGARFASLQEAQDVLPSILENF
jgi:hypothetical protein